MLEVTSLVADSAAVSYTGAGTCPPVVTPAGVCYEVYIDANSDVVYRKSSNGGVSWGAAVVIFAGTATAVAVWYDRWSGISAGLIHCAYTDSGIDDTLYRSIDTENSDTLSGQTTAFAGASTADGGALSITRARGGNLYVKTTIDAGVEGGFFRSVDVGANWTSRTNTEALATTDQWILTPGFAADNQDILCIFWDASADEISRYVYDDSGNSWAETSISTGMVDVAATTTYPHFAAAVDLTNSQILVVGWNGVDTANQDLLGWKVTESAINAFGTTPVLNATDDCGLCAIGIDTATEDWYVFYYGKSDGSHIWSSQVGGFYKKSTDDGANWGSETGFLTASSRIAVAALWCAPRFPTHPLVLSVSGAANPPLFATIDEPAASTGRAIQVNNPSLVA